MVIIIIIFKCLNEANFELIFLIIENINSKFNENLIRFKKF